MASAFERAYWALAAQRNTRILGVFTRLWKRDGKPHYRRSSRACGACSSATSRSRRWSRCSDWFDANIPAEHRAASRGRRRHEPGRAARLRLRAEVAGRRPDTAMVMAAGLGKRMRPLTATRPKPLIEVAGKPLIDHVLDRLRAAGVEKVVVNVHYLADALEAHLESRARRTSRSRSPTSASCCWKPAAGWSRPRRLIDADPFLASTATISGSTGRPTRCKLLASHWDDDEMDALLLLVPQARARNHQRAGRLPHGRAGPAAPPRQSRVAPFVFTGIQMISKRLLRDAPEGPFSTNILWDRAIAEGRCFGAVHQGLWFDVGTPAAIQATEAALEHV